MKHSTLAFYFEDLSDPLRYLTRPRVANKNVIAIVVLFGLVKDEEIKRSNSGDNQNRSADSSEGLNGLSL